MNSSQIINLCRSAELQQKYRYEKTIETHISYIILCEDYVFKIKKPVKLEFLDFSEVSSRKFYCDKELGLNQRFSPGIYIEVIPVIGQQNQFKLGGTEGDIVDYAVKMKRLDDACLLSNRIKKNPLNPKELSNLSSYIHKVHSSCEVCSDFDTSVLKRKLNQAFELKNLISSKIGNTSIKFLQEVIASSNRFLEAYKDIFKERVKQQFIRQVHGDLHLGNIFLQDEHINLIDCIEFEDDYINIDVLDDVSAILVDFDFYNRSEDATTLVTQYAMCFENSPLDLKLLNYYKLLRAITRFSAAILRKDKPSLVKAKKYYTLTKQYHVEISKVLEV